MSTAIRALLRKELVQHKTLFVALACFALLTTWAQVVLLERTGGLTSYLSVASLFAMPVAVVIAIVLGQQLVVREYGDRSQRFIEALPVARGQHEWVKWWLGFGTLLVISLGVWLYTASLASRHEPLSVRFMLLMAARLSAWVFVLWSSVFAVSFLGRLRLGLAALAVLVTAALDSYTPFELDRFGPFWLIDSEQFASERTTLPVLALVQTLVIGVLAVGLARYFLHLREGSFAEQLSRPMSARDKSFVLVLAVVGLGAATLFGHEDKVVPFELGNEHVAQERFVSVAHIEPRWRVEGEALASYLGERMNSLASITPIPESFRLGVIFAPLVEPMEYDVEYASVEHGVVLSADFSRVDDRHFFGAFVFHEVLDTLMLGRTTTVEPLHVLHDGFALYWAVHGANAPPPMGSTDTPEPLLVRALYGTRVVGISADGASRWDRTMESLGDATALSYAYSAWRSLVDEVGHARTLELARQLYSDGYRGDARDWWRDTWNPVESRLEAATDISWETHITTWAERMQELGERPEWESALATLPASTSPLRVGKDEFGVVQVKYEFSTAPAPGTRCDVLHSWIAWFDAPLSPRGMRREQATVMGRTISHALGRPYGAGTRAALALECTPPGEVAPIRLGLTRIVFP